ncbi:hypothetical protein CDL15_Pgr026110 [Punica granatum]|uniref:Uncharacterized protein n=1 Tax=Punica granatum TaxID=22663 RepID=A0A218WD55_PUNGR|nr:hypothetical protein CDL15_Pgr026110 [Punica granatum]
MAAFSSGQESKQPLTILDYPETGQRVHLFTKQVTASDLRLGLRLIKSAETYFNEIPLQLRNEIREHGVDGNVLHPSCTFPRHHA